MSDSNSTAAAGAIGLTGGLPNSLNLKLEITVFAALALWNAVELTTLIFLTFHRYEGLYFWSLLTASIGLIPYTVGFLIKFFTITTGDARWLAIVLLTIGWYAMVTGQSVVLWSRLHLVVSDHRVLKWTGWMIVIDALILHLPTTVLTVGCNLGASNALTPSFVKVFDVYERLQMVMFTVQEFILSSIYIFATSRILRTSLQPGTRKIVTQLFAINIIIIAGDISLVVIEFLNMYVEETMWKPVLYSIKLKLEFAVLSKLVKFVGGGKNQQNGEEKRNSSAFVTDANTNGDISEFVDVTRIASDVTYASPVLRKISRPYENDDDLDLARFEHLENGKFEQDNYT